MENFNICPHAEKCGGCSYQGVSYQDQLKNKEGEVRGYMRAEGLDDSLLDGIVPSPCAFRYRNKMEYTFGNEYKDGPTQLGLHVKRSYISIVSAEDCQLVPEDFNRILKAVSDFTSEKGYPHYNKKLHRGLTRSLILRRGVRTNELLVNIVTTSQEPFDEEGFLSMILSLKLDNEVAGVLHTINDNPADAVKCDELRVLSGRAFYREEIMGLSFEVGAFSFFQTNVEAAERLYRDAISLIDNIDGKTIFDLYCGTGTISQAMALKAGKVTGVEIVGEAVETARRSAMLNGLGNCTFIEGDVQEQLALIKDKPDVIIVDPPRSGLSPKALAHVLNYGVDQIVYVSCNPKTMCQNLRSAALEGYEIKSIRAYDNFSFTKHVETVCLLSKLHKAKHHVSVKLDMDELDLTSAESKATYEEIKKYVAEHNDGMKVSSLNIAQVKAKYGIIERENFNKPKSEEAKQPQCSKEKEDAIVQAVKAFQMI